MSNTILAAIGTLVTMLVLAGFSVFQLQRMQDRPEFAPAPLDDSPDPEPQAPRAA